MKSTLLSGMSRTLCAGVLGLGLLSGGASPSSAATAAPAAPDAQQVKGMSEARALTLMRLQRPLLDAAHRIRLSGAASLPGFSGIVVDPEHSALRLYWRGAPPASVQRTVKLLNGPFTRIAVRPAPAAEPGARGGAPKVSAAGRVNDTSPVSGGALVITENETCTTGFGVVSRATGQRQLLTAGHCGPVGSPWYNGDGDFLGNAVARHPEVDALVVDVDSSDRVWQGAVTEKLDGVDDKARTVTAARSPEVGQYLCTSGAVSGTHCGLRVTRTGVVLSIAGTDVPGQIEAEQVGHTAAVGNGDSGGPVYSTTTVDGPVSAHGMITAYDREQTAPCTGAPTGNGRACSWRVYFTDIHAVLKATGTRLP